MTCAASWLATQATESSDFAQVPIPGSLDILHEAAPIGEEFAGLCDPDVAVDGVTRGTVRSTLSQLAVPDPVPGNQVPEIGRFGYSGGRWATGAVYWPNDCAWRSVPQECWDFSIAGFTTVRKWLSCWVGRQMRAADREQFTLLVRRVAAIIELGKRADVVFEAAAYSPLEIDESAIKVNE